MRVAPVDSVVQRRAFLRATSGIAAGVGIGLAGCVGAPEPGNGGTETEPAGATETPDETPTEAEPPTETPAETDTPTGTPTPDDGQVATRYRFGGRVQGWQGREPQRIADAVNPTLQLEAGETYEVTWENLDGVPHDFTIQDSQGNVLAQTELVSEQGATRTLTFTATEKMAQYVCTVHPSTMVGDIQFGGG